eukprot:5821034-Prymnesium_polylepis.1
MGRELATKNVERLKLLVDVAEQEAVLSACLAAVGAPHKACLFILEPLARTLTDAQRRLVAWVLGRVLFDGLEAILILDHRTVVHPISLLVP